MKSNFVSSGDGEKRDLLCQTDIYIAVVTESFVTNDNCIGEMRDAQALKKKMIALIKEGTKLPTNFHDYDWKLKLTFNNDNEFQECMDKIIKYVEC